MDTFVVVYAAVIATGGIVGYANAGASIFYANYELCKSKDVSWRFGGRGHYIGSD